MPLLIELMSIKNSKVHSMVGTDEGGEDEGGEEDRLGKCLREKEKSLMY